MNNRHMFLTDGQFGASCLIFHNSQFAPRRQFHGCAGVQAGIGTDTSIKGVGAGASDHCAVVAAQMQGRQVKPVAPLIARLLHCGTNAAVSGDAAGNGNGGIAVFSGGTHGVLREDSGDGRLHRCGKILLADGAALLRRVVQEVDHSGFQTGEAEVIGVPGDLRLGQRERIRIAVFGCLIQMDAAGLGAM